MTRFKIGEKFFNRGYQANHEGWYTLTKITTDRWGTQYTMEEIDGDRKFIISPCGVSDVDKGNGSTRIVTEKAYHELRNKQIEALNAWVNKSTRTKEATQ